MKKDRCAMPRSVPSRPRRYGLMGVGLLAGLLVCGWGCGRDQSGRPGDSQSRVNVQLGEHLGAVVAADVEPGNVVLVHLSPVPGEPEQWLRGLRDGLGDGFSVTEMGPDQHPHAAQYGIRGNPPLQYALQQHPDAKAVITTCPISAYERPAFAKDHPPIYALNWPFLPDSVHLFQSGHLTAGIFERADAGSLDQPFDSIFVVATPENLRELVAQY